MVYFLKQKFSKDPKLRIIFYSVLAIIISLIQVTFIPIIQIEGFTPDLLVILICWVSLSEGRFTGIILGFFAGILFDAMSFELLGVNALSKAITGFIAGSWHNEDKVYQNTRNIKFVLIVVITAIVNNLINYLLFLDIKTFTWSSYFFQSVPASAAYTAILATIPMLLLIERKREF